MSVDATVAVEAEPQQRRLQRMVLVTSCLALFISTLDTTVANVALPSIGHDLHAGTTALQWVIASYVVVRGCLLLSAGAAGDRWGRRTTFVWGLAGFGIGSLLCSLAPTVGLLIVFRALQAVGGCFLVPSSLALIADAFPDRAARAKAIGIWSAVTAASTGLGPPLGGLLVHYLGWRSVFWVNLPIVAVAIVLARRYTRQGKTDRARSVDLPGQLAVIVSLVAVTSALIEASESSWTSPLVLTLFAVAAIAVASFIAVELRVSEPLLDPRLFRSRPFTGAAAVATTAYAISGGYLFVNTLYLQDALHYSPLAAGLMVAPATLGNVVLSPLSGRMTAASGPRRPAVLSATCMLAGTLLLALEVSTHPIVPMLIAGYMLIGAGGGLMNTPITNAAVAGLPPERAGVGGAVTSMFRQVGISLGVALLGTLFAGGHSAVSGLHAAYGAAAGLALITLLISMVTFAGERANPRG